MATYTESWDCADSDSISCDLTWTDVVGDNDLVSNEVESQATATSLSRAEADLDSADHYAKFSLTDFGDQSDAKPGPCARFDSSSETYYHGRLRKDTSDFQLFKFVNGSATSLATGGTGSLTLPSTLRFDVDGSSLDMLQDGTSQLTATDTEITSGTRAGIRLFRRWINVDDFETADLSSGVTASVGQAVETSTAQPVSTAKATSVGQAVESSTAQPVTASLGGQEVAVGQAVESSTAQPVTVERTHTVGQASTLATAQAVSTLKRLAIGQAVETSTALAVSTMLGTAAPAPDSRTLTVEAEDRTLVVASEDRTLTVEAEDRTLMVKG